MLWQAPTLLNPAINVNTDFLILSRAGVNREFSKLCQTRGEDVTKINQLFKHLCIMFIYHGHYVIRLILHDASFCSSYPFIFPDNNVKLYTASTHQSRCWHWWQSPRRWLKAGDFIVEVLFPRQDWCYRRRRRGYTRPSSVSLATTLIRR